MPGGRPAADLIVSSPVWTESKRITTKRAIRMLSDEFTNALCDTHDGQSCYCFECIVKEPTLLTNNLSITFLSPSKISKANVTAIPPCTLCGDEIIHKIWL